MRSSTPFVPSAGRDATGGGLTLLELTIAMTLLTVLALGSSLVLIPMARQSRINREIAVADSEARRLIERIHATPFRDVVTRYPDGAKVPVDDLPAGSLNIHYADPTADPLEIRAVLRWDSPDLGAMTVELDTLKTE